MIKVIFIIIGIIGLIFLYFLIWSCCKAASDADDKMGCEYLTKEDLEDI
jgi:uncharacterized membrane protein YuzA (DUF378 family)